MLQCGLWSGNHDTACAAASLISESQLDIAGIDRWLLVVAPHVFDEDPFSDWDTCKQTLSTAGVARLLRDPQCWSAEIRYFFSTTCTAACGRNTPATATLVQHQAPFVDAFALAVALEFDRRRARPSLALPSPAATDNLPRPVATPPHP